MLLLLLTRVLLLLCYFHCLSPQTSFCFAATASVSLDVLAVATAVAVAVSVAVTVEVAIAAVFGGGCCYKLWWLETIVDLALVCIWVQRVRGCKVSRGPLREQVVGSFLFLRWPTTYIVARQPVSWRQPYLVYQHKVASNEKHCKQYCRPWPKTVDGRGCVCLRRTV